MAYKRISPIPVIEGGTGAITLTDHGILIGNGTSAISAAIAGTNGQVMVGVTASTPNFVTPTAGTGLTVTANNAVLEYDLTIPVTVTSGGTGRTALTAHDVLIGNGSAAVTLVAPGATGIPLVSQGASSDPAFSTAVVAGGGTGVTTMTTAYAPVISGTTATGPLQVASTGLATAGFVLTSNGSSAIPSFQAAAGGSSFTWSVITLDQTAAVNNGYICNKAGTLALLLPATAAIGDTIRVTGINTATGWQITQSANQQIFFGTSSTTLGAGGSITSINIRDSIEIVCVVAGASTVYNVTSSTGNMTIV